MKKLLYALTCALCIGTLSLNAQQIVPQTGVSEIADHKMPASYSDTTETWTYYFTDFAPDTISYMNWSVRGDLKIVSSTDSTVTVCSFTNRTNNKDFAKGRIYASYYFNSTPPVCGMFSQYYDIYKTFNDTTIDLVGQDCAKPDEQVTYSIEALVSHNINQEIGMDSYYWSFDASLIDEILYFSGDSSSITFVAGNIPDVGASLSVTVGQKNVASSYSTYTKTILSGVEDPTFINGYAPDTCLRITSSAVNDTIIIDAQNGVTYEWDLGLYDPIKISSAGDTVIFRPNNAPETIVLSVLGGCETKEFEYKINRSLNPGITDIIIPSLTSPYCLNPESSYQFELTNVSSSELIEWTINGDWTGQALMNTTTPNMLTGVEYAILTANTAACPNITVTDTFIVKPKTPSTIIGNSCISSSSETNAYSVTAQTSADSYTWEYPTGWVVNGDSTSNSISFTTDGTTGTLRVKANGCENSDWSSMTISIAANTPSIESQPSCINTHIPTTFGVSITAQPDETYSWILPASLTQDNITANKDSITVSTNTYDIINDSILVYATTGCGNSDTTAIYISNSEGGMNISFSSFVTSWFGRPAYTLNNPPSSYTAVGYLIDNDELSSIDVISMGNHTFQLDTTNTTDLVANTSGWLFVLDITSGSCTTRIIYGDTSEYTYAEIENIINTPLLKSASLRSASSNASDIEITAENDEMKLYPNPVSNRVIIELGDKTNSMKNFMVYNVMGKLIYSEKSKSNKLKIDTQSWLSGTYFVAVKAANNTYKGTLIKK